MRLHKGLVLHCGRQALLCHRMHRRQQPIRTLLYLTGLQSKSINALCFLPYFRTTRTRGILYFGPIHKRGMFLEPFRSTFIFIHQYHTMNFALRMTIDILLLSSTRALIYTPSHISTKQPYVQVGGQERVLDATPTKFLSFSEKNS